MKLHYLSGCAPTPLAHYLKALGVLRLVSEQLDPEARGFWKDDEFVLVSRFTEGELLDFFRNRYEPTPMFNPWGARSGFYEGSSEKTSRNVLARIESSTDSRFRAFQDAIQTTRSVLLETTGGKKPDEADKSGRIRLVRALRSAFRGRESDWIDSVVAIVGSEKGVENPALFGTGGSEGSGSYTAAFMKAIAASLLDRAWDHALVKSIFGREPARNAMWGESFGQFVPTGGASPWDLVLAFEGACVVRSSVVRRSESNSSRWTASPFVVTALASGFSSGARIDEFVVSKGKELPGRGEQWFPMWSAPVSLVEVAHLFQEGRSVARLGKQPQTAFSFGLSVARIGVARGVREFVRFGYLQRNNQATHFAVPLGRFVVPERASTSLNCLNDIEKWMPRLHRTALASTSPGRLKQAERRMTESVLAVIQEPDSSDAWQNLLLAMVHIEAIQVTGVGYDAGPIPGLTPAWIQCADDGSVSFRLALACALQSGRVEDQGSRQLDRGVRRHWLSLENGRYLTRGSDGQARLQSGADRVLRGRSGLEDAIALITRRVVESAQSGTRRIPLFAAKSAAASLSDVARLLAGEIDLDRTMALARAFMAISKRGYEDAQIQLRRCDSNHVPDDAWLAIRLATSPLLLPNQQKVNLDPAILRRLEAGDAGMALELALRRLKAVGVSPAIRFGGVPPATARLWAAALAFPLNAAASRKILSRLDPQSFKEFAA